MFYNLKMGKLICFAFCIAYIASWVSATIIISDTLPKVFDIGDGEKMVVIGDDLDADDF